MSKRYKKREREHVANLWEREREQQKEYAQTGSSVKRLPLDSSVRLVSVFVEGYEDVSFWRGIFDSYEDEKLCFEISVLPREDLAKGKRVLMAMLPQSSENLLLCADSDFDYLFGEQTPQSKALNAAPYMFHTYAYATENFSCYAPSLHNVCVKATKNDARIFDFELFMAEYSRIIYPLFLWYSYSAQLKTENIFTLLDFKSSVRLSYLEVENNGRGTLQWLSRQVEKRLKTLEHHHPLGDNELPDFEIQLKKRGVTPETTYLFMQGHTLMDNVVIVMLHSVCEQLKVMCNERIAASTKRGVALRNELSNYNNSLRPVRDILLDNEGYKDCFLYKKLQQDIERYLAKLSK